ncbi:MAG: F0F1 ATP synthase subunit B [Candidatus Promineifilaceae bacterium]
MGVLDNLGINLGYLILQILGFVILLLLIAGYALNPIMKVLEERKERIAKGLEDARQAAIARDNADAEAKKILEEARGRADKEVQTRITTAEETASGITAKANEEAKGIIANARDEAEEERNRILSELRNQVAAISIAAANKLVAESLDEKRQRQIIGDFFAKVPAKVSGLSGDKAVVTSALPLTDAEKDNVKSTLKVSSVEYRVNPGILGGLIVRVGDQVVDDSIASQMNGLRESLR